MQRKLRIVVSDTFQPNEQPGNGAEGANVVPQLEWRVEGYFLEDNQSATNDIRPKFSSFFQSVVIELDKHLYGETNCWVKWERTPTTQEGDVFTFKAFGDGNIHCTIRLRLNQQPPRFHLNAHLADLLGLGIHTNTCMGIISALWHYIETHNLEDAQEQGFIVCDERLRQILGCSRMHRNDIPERLSPLLEDASLIVIEYMTNTQPTYYDYDIDVAVDGTPTTEMDNASSNAPMPLVSSLSALL